MRRAILTSAVVIIHNNSDIQQLLKHFKWEMSDHPAYSPDLATSDFSLFPELMNCLGGQSFQNNEELQSKVKPLLTSQAATFFQKGTGNLVHRYDKRLNFHGGNVEK
ncbi:hypothetical protein AVEN_215530-1 [Araneus ventricosus]|uniref:Histone-lysine N-methyltransferase SETMAR n=1 Tax=Araneus ventricosus TaxID=182803 RepID=A0A4Y2BGU5_ARAVE|nr:hypothetical protein AVEN_215530-1 [Araneus ventricosus]